jgi:predicted alpha/beta-fold hydrolase
MVSAEDDFLCYKSTQRYLGHALSNPNIMLVETRTGGHLGWQESNPRKNHTLLFDSSSWSDVASADFIDATLKTRKVRRHNVEQNTADIHTWFRSRL